MKMNSIFTILISMLCLLGCKNSNPEFKIPTTPDTDPVVEGDYLVIKGSQYTIKQDLTRGGAICYISKKDGDLNFVNIRDEGRYIQQSYYAGDGLNRQSEGQSPSWSPWPWNPIQVGDYARNRAQILKYGGSPDSTYVKCIPMLWDMNNEPAEATMEQWTSLKDNVLTVKCRLKCNRTSGKWSNKKRDQEIPAVYLVHEFSNLYATVGSYSFSNSCKPSKLDVVYLTDGHWGIYDDAHLGNIPEHWMAFLDDDGFGVAVYSPTATKFLAGAYVHTNASGVIDDATSYISPIRVEMIEANTVTSYTYYLVFGNLTQIRDTIYKLHSSGK